jgi:hypothetical protein
MKVRILKTATYGLFGRGDKVKSQQLEAGTVVDFPPEYAASLVLAGLADGLEVVEPGEMEKLAAKVKPVEEKLTADELPAELAKRAKLAQQGKLGRRHG